MDRKEKLIEEAFQHYRQVGFPYPAMPPHALWAGFFELQETESKICPAQPLLFGDSETMVEINPVAVNVANHFHPHIWDSHAKHMKSPTSAFHNDKKLRRAIRLALETRGKINDITVRNKLKIVSGTQMCSNFRPAAAKAIYQKYLRGDEKRVLDQSMGYGGRLLGFLSLGLPTTHYVGVDPSRQTCIGNKRLTSFFDCVSKVTIIESPFEDIPPNQIGVVDFAFTSPPYFTKEIYSEDPNQSCHRYPIYEDWLDGFLYPLIEKTFNALKVGGLMVLNVQNVRVNKRVYELIEDTLSLATGIGFRLEERMSMSFSGFGSGLEKFKVEAVLVFHKPRGQHNEPM